MPATQATLAQGAIFYTGTNASPIVYTAIAELKDIQAPDETVDHIEATHLASPNFGKEYIPGLYDGGQVEISGNYLGDTTQEGLETLIAARTVFPWKITGPVQSGAKTATITGTGFLISMKRGPFQEGKITEFAAKLKVTGVPVTAVA